MSCLCFLNYFLIRMKINSLTYFLSGQSVFEKKNSYHDLLIFLDFSSSSFVICYGYPAFYYHTIFLLQVLINLQVRTRAVTLQKHISSNDDILKHASKLLKAELPVSVRLIGICFCCFFIVGSY